MLFERSYLAVPLIEKKEKSREPYAGFLNLGLGPALDDERAENQRRMTSKHIRYGTESTFWEQTETMLLPDGMPTTRTGEGYVARYILNQFGRGPR